MDKLKLSIIFYYFYLSIKISNYFLVNCQIDEAITQGQCYITNNQTNTSWALVWEDEFDGAKQLQEWSIEHETKVCKSTLNCNRNNNVQLHQGYLAIESKQEPYYNRNFTSGKMTSKRLFGEGRYEIRAAMPVGRMIRTCISIFNDREFKKTGGLQFTLICHRVGFDFFHSITYWNASLNRFFVPDGKIEEGLSKFHLYGIEWNQNEVHFFFDDHYTKTVKMNETNMYQKNRIRFHVAIVKPNNKPSDDFQDLEWKCPAFIVDYVRVYKNITNQDNLIRENLPKCKNKSNGLNDIIEEETKAVNNICANSLAKPLNVTQIAIAKINVGFNTFLLVILGIIIFFLLFIAFLLVKMFIINKKSAEQINELQDQKEEENLYEVPVYDFEDYDY